jgi:DNA-binding NarL/FixJ family response regulator
MTTALPADRQTADPPAVKVIMVAEQGAFSEVLAARLGAEKGIHVVAVVSGRDAALTVLDRSEADVAVVDERQRDSDVAALTAELRMASPSTRAVVLSGDLEGRRVTQAVRAGAAAWVSKDSSIEELLRVILGVSRGETWISPRLLTRVLADLMDEQRNSSERERVIGRLTSRERQVLMLMARGFEGDQIAESLHLSTNTVRTHRQKLMSKLGVHTSLAAIALARRIGLADGLTGSAGWTR